VSQVIKIENLSKEYRLGEVGTGTIARDLNAWYSKMRGKEDPGSKIDEVKEKGEGYYKALSDVSFEINEGDVVGIIGKNGAGKSTLLKILSRVTTPTSGQFKVKGRIASLLEVGTGFHPDLTGRDNVFLNGAILGMRKSEIRSKFDEIVEFSGVEKFIDTPVKRYSSGMYVRLAFAVAAHLEPEILIVDEVLAVGDIEFQNKCLGKMSEVSRQGRTILFVSHNMQAMSKLCTRGVLLKKGKLVADCGMEEAIKKYLEENIASSSTFIIPEPPGKEMLPGYATKIEIHDSKGELVNEVPAGKLWQLKAFFTINKRTEHFLIGLNITDSMAVNVNTSFSDSLVLEPGNYVAVFKQNMIFFAAGAYNLSLGLSSYERTFHYANNAGSVVISDLAVKDIDPRIIRTTGVGLILNPMEVTVDQLE
jgi:lipopolysaccharide transport system ATP-binding protein